MTKVKIFLLLVLLFVSSVSAAQLLPDNTRLTLESVQRWMASNRDFAPIIQILDTMHTSDDALKKFEMLPIAIQDQKIFDFMRKHQMFEKSQQIASHHGWKSVGEYMRLSTKLGNAIAAYFFANDSAKLSQEQKKALHEKTDAAILAAPVEDVHFVKSHEKLLKSYIQAYADGR